MRELYIMLIVLISLFPNCWHHTSGEDNSRPQTSSSHKLLTIWTCMVKKHGEITSVVPIPPLFKYWHKRIKLSVTWAGCCPEDLGSWTACWSQNHGLYFCHGFWSLHLVQYTPASSSTKFMSNTVLILPVNHGKCFFISLVAPWPSNSSVSPWK